MKKYKNKRPNEAIRKEILSIISEARERDESLRKNKAPVALNGIKDLVVDKNSLMNFMKDIKVKEVPTIVNAEVAKVELKPRKEPKLTYYEIWYSLITSELKEFKI